MKRSLTILLTILVLNLGLVSIASAQSDAKKTAKVKEKITKLGIGRKARIDVKTNDSHEFVGWVSDRHEDDFVLTDDFNEVHTVRYDEVKKFVGKNLTTGQSIAIGVGIGVGALILLVLLAARYGD